MDPPSDSWLPHVPVAPPSDLSDFVGAESLDALTFNSDNATEMDSGVASHIADQEPALSAYDYPLSDDLEELKFVRDSLRRKKAQLLKDKEHTQLVLHILRLREEIDLITLENLSARKRLSSHHGTPYATYRPPKGDIKVLPDQQDNQKELNQPGDESPQPTRKVSSHEGSDDPNPPSNAGESSTFEFTPERHQDRKSHSMCSCHGCCFAFGHFIALLFFAATVVLHILAWYQTDLVDDLYYTKRRDVWESFNLEFVHSSWIFWLSVGVYGLQVFWFLYAFSISCRSRSTVHLLIHAISGWGYLLLILCYCCCVAWLFIWDRLDELGYSAICIGGAAFFGLLSLGLFSRQLFLSDVDLLIQVPCDRAMLRIWLLNGVAGQGFWALMLLRYHACLLIETYTDLDAEYNFYTFLAMGAFMALVWFPADVFGAKRQFSYVFLPYVLLILSLLPVLLDKDQLNQVQFIITAILMAFYGLLTVIKLGVTIGRERDSGSTHGSEGIIKHDPERDLETFHFSPNMNGSVSGTLQKY